MYGDRGGDRKGNMWGVGKAKHGRKRVTRQTQQNVQQGLQLLSVSMFVALSNRLRPSTIYLLLGSRFPQHQILERRTFENLTP